MSVTPNQKDAMGYIALAIASTLTASREYVLDRDAFDCPVVGWVHEDDTRTVQGISVHDDATEYNERIGDYILTEEAAAVLKMPYLGNDDEDETEDEQEQAA